MHYPLLALILFCVTAPAAAAQGLHLQWVHGITGVSSAEMAIDDQKNLYIAGGFTGTVDFDPGAGTANLTADTAFGKGTTFLAKYNPQGSFLFVRQLSAFPRAISIDHSGHICLAGGFSAREDFDPGNGTAALTPLGSDIFIAKYDSAGNYINAFSMGGAGSDVADALAVDASGNLYITGSFSSTADFDPGSGTHNLISGGGDDIYLAKYSSTGALSYAFRLACTGSGGFNSDEGAAVAVDAAGNAYLGGRHNGTIDLDPGSGSASFASFGGIDGFVAKYGPTGSYISGFTYHGIIYDVVLDGTGNMYISGTNPDSIDADPGPGRAMIYSSNNFDSWLAKYDASGNLVFAKGFQNNGAYTPTDLSLNHKSSVYMSGRFNDTLYFTNTSTDRVLSQGGFDGFLTKFDASGNYTYSNAFGSTGFDEIECILNDKQGSVWLSGPFNGTVDFDPGSGNSNLSSTAGVGLFFGRYFDEDATRIAPDPKEKLPLKVYAADRKVFVDFTALDQVNARVKVVNMLGQTVVEVKHTSASILELPYDAVAAQQHKVVVSCNGMELASKVWLD